MRGALGATQVLMQTDSASSTGLGPAEYEHQLAGERELHALLREHSPAMGGCVNGRRRKEQVDVAA